MPRIVYSVLERAVRVFFHQNSGACAHLKALEGKVLRCIVQDHAHQWLDVSIRCTEEGLTFGHSVCADVTLRGTISDFCAAYAILCVRKNPILLRKKIHITGNAHVAEQFLKIFNLFCFDLLQLIEAHPLFFFIKKYTTQISIHIVHTVRLQLQEWIRHEQFHFPTQEENDFFAHEIYSCSNQLDRIEAWFYQTY